jgi:adenylate kinase
MGFPACSTKRPKCSSVHTTDLASEDSSSDERSLAYDDLTIPDFVFSLEASDQFIKQRIMKLPESAVAGTKNAEDALTKRLEDFRKLNTDELTVLNYFDELEIHPVIINVELGENQIDAAFEKMIKIVGSPRNYGPTPEKLAEEKRIIEANRIKAEELASEERAKREQQEIERHQKAIADWV